MRGIGFAGSSPHAPKLMCAWRVSSSHRQACCTTPPWRPDEASAHSVTMVRAVDCMLLFMLCFATALQFCTAVTNDEFKAFGKLEQVGQLVLADGSCTHATRFYYRWCYAIACACSYQRRIAHSVIDVARCLLRAFCDSTFTLTHCSVQRDSRGQAESLAPPYICPPMTALGQ